MKNWFNNLEDKYKLFLIIGLYGGTVLFAVISQYVEFFSLLCVGCLIFAIVFTAYYSKYKKSRKDQTNQHINITTTKTILDSTQMQVTETIKKPEINVDATFPKIYDKYVLRWQYKENIALVQNLDKIEIDDRHFEYCGNIKLVPEPNNEYDNNAVALYKGEHKLGYFYKGQTQKMILDYLDRKNYLIKTFVCFLDKENSKLAIAIAFYQKLDSIQLDTLTVSLTKIYKSEDFGTSRYENVSLMNIGDCVEISDNYDGNYTVCDEYGNELGELNAKKVEDIFNDIIYAKIEDIELTESENYKVKISIFYR